jgi:hypothetical protein
MATYLEGFARTSLAAATVGGRLVGVSGDDVADSLTSVELPDAAGTLSSKEHNFSYYFLTLFSSTLCCKVRITLIQNGYRLKFTYKKRFGLGHIFHISPKFFSHFSIFSVARLIQYGYRLKFTYKKRFGLGDSPSTKK